MQEELEQFMAKIDRGLFAGERDGKIDYQVSTLTSPHFLLPAAPLVSVGGG
jgi:hypothetical protein